MDSDQGVVVEHGSLGWYDVHVGAVLAELTRLPVRVDGHARALAAAERLYGAGQRGGTLVHLFVGNVLDAAILTGNAVYRGPRSAAGTVAHLPFGDPAVRCACGRHGCLETAVAEWAITRTTEKSIMDIVAAAQDGDRTARNVLLRRARTLAPAVALLFDVVDPHVLVITEPGVTALPECLDALRTEVATRSHVCGDPSRSIMPSSFPTEDVLSIAAGAVQLDALFREPATLADS